MSKNLNLSEAAASILQASVDKAKSGQEKFGLGKSLPKAPQQSEVDLGSAGEKSTDANYDSTRGVPTATPPGAKPPVGAEPMHKLAKQPQEHEGRSDLLDIPMDNATSYDAIRDRKKGDSSTQMFKTNPNAKAPYVPEDFEYEDDDYIEEASYENDIAAMLAGENLSEAFVEKATTIFEAAVKARTAAIVEEMEEVVVEEFETAVETMKEQFANKIDSYLDYVIESWMEDNQLAVESGLRSEIVEGFIGALKCVFEDHYIDIPEEKVMVVEGLAEKVQELENQVNEEILRNIRLRKEISEHKKAEVLHTVCEGLTLFQVEKIKSIAQSMDFNTEEEFSNKLVAIKESYYPSNIIPATNDALDDLVILEESRNYTKSNDPLMDVYVKTITKTSHKQ